MSEVKVKILEAKYDEEKDLVKIKVLKVETGKEVTWALLGDDFDSFVAQMTGKPLKYKPEQRPYLCFGIIGIEFINRIEFDIDNTDIDKAKDKGSLELQRGHDVVDMYPFYEIQQEAMEEAIHGTEEKDKS